MGIHNKEQGIVRKGFQSGVRGDEQLPQAAFLHPVHQGLGKAALLVQNDAGGASHVPQPGAKAHRRPHAVQVGKAVAHHQDVLAGLDNFGDGVGYNAGTHLVALFHPLGNAAEELVPVPQLHRSLVPAPAQGHIQGLAGQGLRFVEAPLLAPRPDGHGGGDAVSGGDAANLVQNGEAAGLHLAHIPVLDDGDVPVLIQLFQEAVVFLGKGLNDMLNLAHGLASLVLLGVQKQLGEVVNHHQHHPGAGIEVLLGVDLQVVVIKEIEHHHRLRLAVGAQPIKGVHPLPHRHILPFRGAVPGEIQLGGNLRDALPKGVQPPQDMPAAVVVLPQHLSALPQNHGGHGVFRHRIPLGPKEGFPDGGKLLFGIPADAGAVEHRPNGHHPPGPQEDGEEPQLHKEVGGPRRQSADGKQPINHRAVKVHPVQHSAHPPFGQDIL